MPNENESFARKVAFVTGAATQDAQQIRIHMRDQTVTATLNSSEAARDLVAMLPLSIRMRDHLRREKTGPIPEPLSERTEGSATYQSGDLGYWRLGGNFVIFYRHDGLDDSISRNRPSGTSQFWSGSIRCPWPRRSDGRFRSMK